MQTGIIDRHIGEVKAAYTVEEARFLKPWQIIRQRLFHPIIRILLYFKVTPDMLSYFSVFLGLAFCFLAFKNFSFAFWLLVASILCDGLDGVLAREMGTSSTKGAFTDVVCDQTVLALSVAGTIWQGTVNPILGVFFVYIYTTFMMFIFLHGILKIPSQFIVRPGRNLFFIAIGIYYFFGINLLNIFLVVSLLTIPILLLSFFRIKMNI